MLAVTGWLGALTNSLYSPYPSPSMKPTPLPSYIPVKPPAPSSFASASPAASSKATPTRSVTSTPRPKYRTIDGTRNHPYDVNMGAVGSIYTREASGAQYRDDKSVPSGWGRPSARSVSNAFCEQAPDVSTRDERFLSTAIYEWGQFLDHDIGLVNGGDGSEVFNIPVPKGDVWFDPTKTGTKTIGLTRSGFLAGSVPRQQTNMVTSWIDASQVYGSDTARAAFLRTYVKGGLKSRQTPKGEQLVFNTGGFQNDNPTHVQPATLYVAGDVRANEQPGLTTLHVIFLREHNRLAAKLAAANPYWSDETIYQEARARVGAMMQAITYNEWLPAILGSGRVQMPPYTGYDIKADGRISNTFATALYRVGHSMVGPDIGVINGSFVEVDSLDLADIFFNPSVLDNYGVEPFARYFATDIMQAIDGRVVNPLRNFLFGPPGAGGFDLAALNIQRGRDHGIPDYNTVRADLGLPRATCFEDITKDKATIDKLWSLYGSVNNVDAWIGALLEDKLPGASVGLTHATSLVTQLRRLRDADRFWYTNVFSGAALAEIEASTLSEVIMRNSNVKGLQRKLFYAARLRCAADYDMDDTVTVEDLRLFQSDLATRYPRADINRDGGVDSTDACALAQASTEFCDI